VSAPLPAYEDAARAFVECFREKLPGIQITPHRSVSRDADGNRLPDLCVAWSEIGGTGVSAVIATAEVRLWR
jgi:hypothetical protein